MASVNSKGKLARLQARIAKLDELKLVLEREEDERFLNLIKQSGLYDLDLTNAEVLVGLNDLAGRFRSTAQIRTGLDNAPTQAAQADPIAPGARHGQG